MTTQQKSPEENIQTVQREMTITQSDFLRLLPKALKNRSYKRVKNVIFVSLGTGELEITLASETQKTIGSLKLPILQVNFSFENCPEETFMDFFKDFDLAFQKGGG